MPKDLKDFPRPPSDNGRGLHGTATAGWTGGSEGYDYWIKELVDLGVKWFKVIDDGGSSLPLCEKLLATGIFPIVRILRRDPPPNDTPEPNPGHIGKPEERTIQHLIAAGVRYFETNNEPNLTREWKHGAMLGNALETAKLVALNWLFDARFILSAGGYPGLPAMSSGSTLDLIGALVALGRQSILLEGCWTAIHNYHQNHPLHYPEDPVSRTGQALTQAQYDMGAFTQWAWWNNTLGRADTLDEVNVLRANSASLVRTVQQDHACFREFEYYNALAMKYLGRSIPIISTEGGLLIGRRDDLRYPRITPTLHSEQTVAMFDFMHRQAPDYYFAAVPWLLCESGGWEDDAWYNAYWKNALANGSDGRDGIPEMAVPGANLSDRLPVVEAVKSMQNLARRLPGAQPAPPQPAVIAPPARPAPAPVASWLRDAPGTPAETQAMPPEPSVVPPSPKIEKPIAPPPAKTEKPAVAPPLETEKPVTPPAKIEKPAAPPLETEKPVAPPAKIEKPVAPPTKTEKPAVPPTKIEKPTATPAKAKKPATLSAPPPSQPPQRIERPAAPPPPPERIPVHVEPPVASPPPMPDFSAPEKLEHKQPPAEIKPTPLPRAKPPEMLPQYMELEWDWRLDALNISLETSTAPMGQVYWKLIRAVYQGPEESEDNHYIQYKLVDEYGKPVANQKVWQGWSDNKTDATTNEQGVTTIVAWMSYSPDEGEHGPYSAWIDGSPGDVVHGMGLPRQRHVNFLLTWQRTIV